VIALGKIDLGLDLLKFSDFVDNEHTLFYALVSHIDYMMRLWHDRLGCLHYDKSPPRSFDIGKVGRENYPL